MTSDNTTPDLKPCPFCGFEQINGDDGKALVYFTKPIADKEYKYCECHDCGARTADCDTQEDAIEAWNTRADLLTAERALADALHAALLIASKSLLEGDILQPMLTNALALYTKARS